MKRASVTSVVIRTSRIVEREDFTIMYDNTEVSHTLQHCALAYFPCRRSLLCHMPVLQMYFVLRVFKNR